jgi:DUF971 family protein
MHIPVRIAASRSRGLTIHWQDGHTSHFDLRYLRDHCPCAACATRPPSAFPIFTPASIVAVEPVGSYALRINWSDGHSTGIYSFDYLRRICPCGACAPPLTPPSPPAKPAGCA